MQTKQIPQRTKNILYRDRLANNLRDMSSFEKLNKDVLYRLYDKGLSFKKFDDCYFFSSIFDIFAVLSQNSLVNKEKVKEELIDRIEQIYDWVDLNDNLAFLDDNEEIVDHFVDNPDNPIFMGLLLTITSVLTGINLKLYQLQKGNCLVSCQINSGKVDGQQQRVAILSSPFGPIFGLLEKNSKSIIRNIPVSLADFSTIENDKKSSLEGFLDNIQNFNFDMAKEPPKELDEYDEHIMKLIVTNLGLNPHFFIDYSEYVRYQEFNHVAEKELIFLINNIVKSVSTQSCQKLNSLSTKDTINQIQSHQNIQNQINTHLNNKLHQPCDGNMYQSNANNFRQMNADKRIAPSMAHLTTPESKDLPLTDEQKKEIMKKTNKISVFEITEKDRPRTRIFKNSSIERNKQKKNIHSVINLSHHTVSEKTKAPIKPIEEETKSKKPTIIDQSENRHNGKLKFFNEKKSFGFIIRDDDLSNIFFHLSDMESAGISANFLNSHKNQRFSFIEMLYKGKTGVSKKAVDIKLLY